VRSFALSRLPGALEIGALESPISGADGNREYLLGLRKAAEPA
jgi:23S rRNA (cytidine1920-2'-O)/16S rRNA (cytidine1409-2'-O)-methyltransferase